MYLVNESHQLLNIEDIRAELQNLDDVQVLNTDDLEQELGSYYNQALQLEASKYQFTVQFANVSLQGFFPGIGSILESVRKFVCRVIDATSTRNDIIDAILDALSGIIPGGVFIAPIIKKLVKYILDLGFDAFCPVPATVPAFAPAIN